MACWQPPIPGSQIAGEIKLGPTLFKRDVWWVLFRTNGYGGTVSTVSCKYGICYSSAQLRLPFKASEMCNEQPFQSGTTCLCRMYRMSFSSATTWLGPACQEIQARPAFFSLIHSASVAGRYCTAWWSFAICVLDTLGPVLLSVRLCRTLQDKPTLAEGAQRGH